ncbi:hypothetical protein HDA40_004309 [Hamadaea flava]|uniref:DNRLRE domain-containing protein n=1 Tax=Hamadaea flava TaxID=1742688 RepID=A0ABV8LZE6_9ACTN|nr:hypothetical protein [Hamadaea flava]MCP2325802.1 hypothetical protein [Hamadaea flava]
MFSLHGEDSGRRLRSVYRGIARLTAAAVAGTALTAAMAQPAAAASIQALHPVAWAYTDSREPTVAHFKAAEPVPIGSWRDDAGKHHKSRGYFTFDLSGLSGQTILEANAFAKDVVVEDCSKPRTWELWTTTPITSATTWTHAPTELTQIAVPGGYWCPASGFTMAVTDAVRQAVAAGETAVTLEIRVPEEHEGNIHLGRSIDPDVPMSVISNLPPTVPTNVKIDGQACGAELYVRWQSPVVTALVTDPDVSPVGIGSSVGAVFALWPTDAAAERQEWRLEPTVSSPFTARLSIPAERLTDGREYAIAVKGVDGNGGESEWTQECRFTVDRTGPATAPTVTSTDYPDDDQWTHGGPGITGKFVFDAAGDPDTTGFLWGESGAYRYVAADHPGGSAIVDYTPTRDGPQTLVVEAVDRAFNSSPDTRYYFLVKPTAPLITDLTPDAWVGDPHHLSLQPRMADVVKYRYQVDGAAEQEIAAAADGTAVLDVTPAQDGSVVYLYSVTADGVKSGTNWAFIWSDSTPVVTSADFPSNGPGPVVGTTVNFTFAPHSHGVVSYQYSTNDGESGEVVADAEGKATVSLVLRSAAIWLEVYSVTGDGTTSMPFNGYFVGTSIAPKVESTVYPAGARSGGPGTIGRFELTPTASNVVEYVYQFSYEAERVIPARADGSAAIDWAPTAAGWYHLTVRSRSTSGQLSDATEYAFEVDPRAPVITSPDCAYPTTVSPGQLCTFVLTNQLDGGADFVYQFEGADQQAAVIGPDGTATITWTATDGYYHSLTVRSRTTAGVLSGYTYTTILVG